MFSTYSGFTLRKAPPWCLLLKIFTQLEANQRADLKFLNGYTQTEFDKVLGFLDNRLASKNFILDDKLSGADFMLAFIP